MTALGALPLPTRTPRRHMGRLTFDYAVHDTLVALRNVAFVAFTVALPIALFVIFRFMFSNQDFASSPAYASLMVNMAAYGGFAAALNAGARIQLERASGWMRQLTVSGLPPQAFVVGKAVSAMAVVLPAIIGTFVTGKLLGGITEPFHAWLASGVLMWLGMVPFVVLGLAVGLWIPASAVQPVVTILMLAMAMLGGLWWPLDTMPEIVERIGRKLPTYWLGELGRMPFIAADFEWRSVAVLVGWTMLAGVVSVFGFRSAARSSRR